jgi:hypothetical protein
MKVRHRIPSVFNLSMVDVLCCALGCVILLWLLNLREAKERAILAGSTQERLNMSLKDLAAAKDDLKALNERLGTLQALLGKSQADLSSTASMLAATTSDRDKAKTQIVDLDKLIAQLRLELVAEGDRLEKKRKELAELEKKTAMRIAMLEGLVRDKDATLAAADKRTLELDKKLTDEEARARQLQGLADSLRDELKGVRDKYAAEEAMAKKLEKDLSTRGIDLADLRKLLADANVSIEALKGEKRLLTADLLRARLAVENRFEGIALTGKRVLFLVDMSGSMDLVDEKTPAPGKWLGVRQAVTKIMKSLPDLEKFQVILFSDRVAYLMGNEGQWHDYDPKTSPDRVMAGLAAIKPNAGTNMYVAMEAAFRLRSLGLDTIYLMSDGLPNMGEGTPTNPPRQLSEVELGEILGKVIRKKLKDDWNREVIGRPRVRINTVGFFFESPDVGAFLWALARENDGSFVGMSKP